MTGLTDEQRADFKLMKSISGVTLAAPGKRIESLQNFARRLESVPEIKSYFLQWGVKFRPNLQSFAGRTFPPEKILAGGGQTGSYKVENADWGNMLRNLKLFGPVKCPKWAVIYPKRDENNVKEFVKTLKGYSRNLGFDLGEEVPIAIQQTNDRAYLDALTKVNLF